MLIFRKIAMKTSSSLELGKKRAGSPKEKYLV